MVFPVLVTGGIEKVEALSNDQIMQQLNMPGAEQPVDAPASDPLAPPTADPYAPPSGDAMPAEDDPMKAVLEAAERDAKKKP